VFPTHSTIFQLYRGGHFFLVEKATDLPQITDKPYCIVLYTLPLSGFELTTSVV